MFLDSLFRRKKKKKKSVFFRPHVKKAVRKPSLFGRATSHSMHVKKEKPTHIAHQIEQERIKKQERVERKKELANAIRMKSIANQLKEKERKTNKNGQLSIEQGLLTQQATVNGSPKLQRAKFKSFDKMTKSPISKVNAQSLERFTKKNPFASALITRSYGDSRKPSKIAKNVYGHKIDTKKAENKIAYKVGGFAGDVAFNALTGGFAGGTAFTGGIKGLAKGGLKATAKHLGKNALGDVLTSTPLNVSQSISESKNRKEFIQQLLINSTLDATVGTLIEIPSLKKSFKLQKAKQLLDDSKKVPPMERKKLEKEAQDQLESLGDELKAQKPKVAVENSVKAPEKAPPVPYKRFFEKKGTTSPKTKKRPLETKGEEYKEKAEILTEYIPRQKTKESAMGKAERLLVDDFAHFERFGRDYLKSARLSGDELGEKKALEFLGSINAVRQAQKKGVFNLMTEQKSMDYDTVGKSAQDILKPVHDLGEKAWKDGQTYLYHRHNISRARQGKDIFGRSFKKDNVLNIENGFKKVDKRLKDAGKDAQKGYVAYKQALFRNDPESVRFVKEMEKTFPWFKKTLREENQLKKSLKEAGERNESLARESEDIVRDLENRYPRFRKWGDEVVGYFRNLRQRDVDAGLLSQDSFDQMVKENPYYVPTRRADVLDTKRGQFPNTSTKVKGKQTVREATGSKKDLLSIDQQFTISELESVRGVNINRMLGDFARLQGREIEPSAVNRQLAEDIYDGLNEQTILKENPNKGTYEAVYYKNGKQYAVPLNEGEYQGLKTLMNQGIDENILDNIIGDALAKSVTIFKQLVTAWNPIFLVRNFVRDTGDAIIYSQDTKGFIINFLPSVKELAKGNDSEMVKLFRASGVQNASLFDMEKTFLKNSNFLKKPLESIEFANQFVEMIPRFVEFNNILKKELDGRPLAEATKEMVDRAGHGASDITVNFGRSGSFTRFGNKYFVPFLNPSVQGFDKILRTLKGQRGVFGYISLATKITVFGMAPRVLNEWVCSEQEDWQDIPEWVRNTNFLIPMGDGEYLKIPQGRFASMTGVLPAMGIRKLKGEDIRWGDLYQTFETQIAPMNPVETNILAPIKSMVTNKNWYGVPIDNREDLTKNTGERQDSGTTKIGKWIGDHLPENAPEFLSPKRIDYALGQYSGFFGDMVLPRLTDKAEPNPFKKAFVLDTVFTNDTARDYYEIIDRLDKTKNSSGATMDDELAPRYYQEFSDKISEKRDEIETIQNGIWDDEDKRAKVRKIQAEINQLMKDGMNNEKTFMDFVEESKDKYSFLGDDKEKDLSYENAQILLAEHLGNDPWEEARNRDTIKSSDNRLALSYEAEALGMSAIDYKDVFALKQYDANGNGSVTQDEAVAYLNEQDMTSQQKDLLWRSFNKGWKKRPYADGSTTVDPDSVGSSSGGGKGGGGKKGKKGKKKKKTAHPKIKVDYGDLTKEEFYSLTIPQRKALMKLLMKKFKDPTKKN